MPIRCLVPGCTSGTSKSDKEKVYFFSVPRDEVLKDQWKNAIGKTHDNLLQSKRKMCDKHFQKEDVLWKRFLTDSNGVVVGEVNFFY